MTESQQTEANRFWGRLLALHNSDDRAALARLRRAVADPAGDYSVFATIGNALPADLGDSQLDAYLFVACLFAVHPTPTKEAIGSLGTSARHLRAKMTVGQESLDQRVAALLNSDLEDLPLHLRHIIRLLASYDVAVDYPQLLKHLLRWESEERWVQKRLARDYWSPERDAETKAENESTSEIESVVEGEA